MSRIPPHASCLTVFICANNLDFPQINYIIKDILKNFGIEHITLIMSKVLEHIPQASRTPLVRAIYQLFKKKKKFPLIQFVNKNLHNLKKFDFEFDNPYYYIISIKTLRKLGTWFN